MKPRRLHNATIRSIRSLALDSTIGNRIVEGAADVKVAAVNCKRGMENGEGRKMGAEKCRPASLQMGGGECYLTRIFLPSSP
jgi:hypothetical protein